MRISPQAVAVTMKPLLLTVSNTHYISTIMHLILAVTTSNSISVHSLIINIPQFKWFTNYHACQLDRELPCKSCTAV